ncbi:MAG: hypothetical protein R2856_08240 [Caldilineaceae bacterium]
MLVNTTDALWDAAVARGSQWTIPSRPRTLQRRDREHGPSY